MQKPYMKPGDIWLPYAYDPIWHAQTTIPAKDRQYDAALIGLPYPDRNKLVTRLRNDGLNVFYEIGPCYNDARDIYHNTRVGLNWSSLQDTTARVFELMAFGICPVLNRVPDLMELFTDGEHFLGFNDLEEAAQKAEMAAKDFELCERIGNAARNAVEPHSWDARVQKVLEVAELVPLEDA
jgi:glycosyltransferase involved in cell wall biosynthesis